MKSQKTLLWKIIAYGDLELARNHSIGLCKNIANLAIETMLEVVDGIEGYPPSLKKAIREELKQRILEME